VKVAEKVLDDMFAHARQEAPGECCGLLIGDRYSIDRNVRARNRESGTSRYLIDPDDHFAAIHAARVENRRVIGAYHSHPATAAQPSESDLAEASGGSDFLYVIISLAKTEGDVFAYRLKHGRVIPVLLALSP
jgi:proteasome lid subunit RPN8/RPN11